MGSGGVEGNDDEESIPCGASKSKQFGAHQTQSSGEMEDKSKKASNCSRARQFFDADAVRAFWLFGAS